MMIVAQLPAGADDKATIEQKLDGSRDDDDIVLAEYDSDPTVAKGSCDTEERYMYAYMCTSVMYELLLTQLW